ncbi:uncharacterized protein K441DRAFT_658681 [Cenococcum geophilum 1.58]|uniref:uncharacterized protein n=1 Tax=Cenococcum geophilum 1.58 TaxID=794803 RepID=UPI00358E61F2|nr:hypothetical protein K441DRAFT_658681 [Cenococcum geophilum 1.58]
MNNITFYNKYYFNLGAKETHRIKRRSSNLYRYLPQNVYRKKGHLKLFNIFIIIGKINLKANTEQDLKLLILPSLLPDLLIMESLAYPIKKKFYLKRVEKDTALERFIDI